ncbi:PAS domain-containing sensor histidine kinase [Allostella sp. ATCC 35155]|nr:PAS domain-containing sensor histidine kinase [Stella sp. ATCC 35155]
MGRRALAWARRTARPEVDAAAILATLVDPVLVVDERLGIRFANPAAEQFFDMGLPTMVTRGLDVLLPPDSPVCALVASVRQTGGRMVEHGVGVDTPRTGTQLVTVQVAPLGDGPSLYVVTLQPRSIVERIDHQMTHRGAARSVSAMAAILAHEVKNPLSGIRGAAQLLEQNASHADRELTRLICDETDRICALVDRMEVFSDSRPIERSAVNIHEVLEHVRRLAESGFARGVRFVELYDPSLPPVLGNRDMLVQVLLNLVKNAAEAVPEQGGEIMLSTAYQQGVRLAVPGTESRMHLPLVVTVQDNGSGIPERLRPNLFDPFVTTKHNGKGLGLALVAKIVDDHGGLIEFDSQQRRTTFRIKLPMFEQEGTR